MNKIQKKVIVSVRGFNLDSGYYVKVLMKDGSLYFLNEFIENGDEISFDRFKNILQSMKLNDIYLLKKKLYNASIALDMINDELRRRHAPLTKKTLDLKNKLSDSNVKEIKLNKNSVIIKVSNIKEK